MAAPQPPCAFCGGRTEFLCDAPVRLTKEELLEQFRKGERCNGALRSCDKPFCRACRTQVGVLFVCSRGARGRKRSCDFDSVDHCPDHAPPIAEGEAEAKRKPPGPLFQHEPPQAGPDASSGLSGSSATCASG